MVPDGVRIKRERRLGGARIRGLVPALRPSLAAPGEPFGPFACFPPEPGRHTPEDPMDIALDKVCEVIIRARAIDVKEGMTDPASGSNPIDDGNLDALTSSPDDATEEEMRDVIAGLNDDEIGRASRRERV